MRGRSRAKIAGSRVEDRSRVGVWSFMTSALAANILISFVIDNKRIGRWWILFGGMVMMTVGMLVTGIIGTVYVDPEVSKSASSILVTFITISAIGSVIGPGAAGWTYLVEAGSYRLRAKVATLSNMGNCLMMSASGIYAPYLISTTTYAKWGEKVGYFFGSFGLIGLVITWFFIPDLTGRSYAQIDELFERQIPARQFKSTVCTGEYGRDLLEKEDERH